jgi:hypothetical protein
LFSAVPKKVNAKRQKMDRFNYRWSEKGIMCWYEDDLSQYWLVIALQYHHPSNSTGNQAK